MGSDLQKDREDRDVPAAIRAAVIERDNGCCRVCGQWVEYPALHHVYFRSHGGRPGEGLHVVTNLVVVGWLPGHDCHLPLCHGPQAEQVRGLLLRLIDEPALGGVTALALNRWEGLPPLRRRGGSRPWR